MIKKLLLWSEIKKNLKLSSEEMKNLQKKLLKIQLVHANNTVPFYREWFEKRDQKPGNTHIKEIPIVTKEIIKKNYKKFISEQYNLEKCHKSYTSGSTGEPFLTYFDSPSWIRKRFLVKIRARAACGLKLGQRLAVLDAEEQKSLDKNNKSNPLITIKRFSVFNPATNIIPAIEAFRPQNLYGFPGYLFEAREEAKKASLKKLKRIFTSSEVLETTVRKSIEHIYDAKVFDIYGTTEFKEIAWECKEHQGYHINEDEVFVEVLEKNEKNGEKGDIVITDLRNKVMPLIRFNTQDKGELLNRQCSCGVNFSMMKPHGGRASDSIYLPTGERISPYRFTTSIENVKGILQYQIIQKSKDKLKIKIIHEKNIANPSEEIKKIIEEITHHEMKIEVDICKIIPREQNGKVKVVKALKRGKI